MLIDTHSHIYSEEFNGETDEIIKRALDKNVQRIILPNIDSSSIKMMLDLSNRYPEVCYPMIGIHPTSVKEDYEEELEVIEYWLSKRKFIGIGEIGIDLYWDDTFRKQQEYVFIRQLTYAKKLKLPLAIHTRDSFDLTFQLIQSNFANELQGVFHSFTGTIEQAKMAIDAGFKIGVGGIVTFKNSGLDKIISQLNPTDLVLETDSPYLSPAPLRGKRNESSYTIFVAQKLAQLFDLSVEEISAITTKTAEELFFTSSV